MSPREPSAVGDLQQRRAALLLLACSLLHYVALGYEEPLPDDRMQDDDKDAIIRVRERLAAKDNATTGGTYGVVMVAGPRELSYSPLTIPIWREYCKKYGMGFWLQEEPLNTDLGFEWTKPRLLLELLRKVKWRYFMVVDADSLPVDFNRPWEYMIKLYMRYKRYVNDHIEGRFIFCPQKCDEEYKSAHEEGACAGAILSGCIYSSSAKKAKKTARLVKSWYVKRKNDDLPSDDPLLGAFEAMKENNYDAVFYKDVQQDVGKAKSKVIATYGWSKEFGHNIRDRIYDAIKRHKRLSRIANQAHKAAEL